MIAKLIRRYITCLLLKNYVAHACTHVLYQSQHNIICVWNEDNDKSHFAAITRTVHIKYSRTTIKLSMCIKSLLYYRTPHIVPIVFNTMLCGRTFTSHHPLHSRKYIVHQNIIFCFTESITMDVQMAGFFSYICLCGEHFVHMMMSSAALGMKMILS